MKLTDKQFEQYRASCIAAVGAPPDDLNEQHDAVLKIVFQSMETFRGAGYDYRAIALAASSAVVSHCAHLSGDTRREIAIRLRECADEIEATGTTPTH